VPRISFQADPQPVTLSNVFGSVTLDLATGRLFVLNLVGDITSFSFTGAGSLSFPVEVHFVQDATGGRILGGVADAVNLAGGGLVLSTIGGRRDVLQFRHIAGQFWETSRSLYLL
jgi:hypothetical protein